MKKKILICLLIAVLALSSCMCSEGHTPSQFATIEDEVGYKIVYHKKTKVMYAVSKGSYNRGNFTLLVNSDGTPQLYNE